MSLEKYLVEHCSPTLASLKTANMFSCRFESEKSLITAIDTWNELFRDKGVELIILKKENGLALIYVCRRNMLTADLNKDGVKEFLTVYGYRSTDTDYAIRMLKRRLKTQKDFPHEIGIFLSYPLEDVKGFIEQGGANCLCTGCWKVYCNECEAQKTFSKFKKCREVYSRLYANGSRDILQLTVKA
ncbi:MAG: DUF3793 family protein [Ruminococcaceae bacterium]|nr:DUF3793 family protein [Oscillospiraceae bacterium]